jgi:pyruvate,orthophosphate dikinase
LEVEITRLELMTEDADLILTKRKLLSRIDSMVEMNPMLGLRGVRLAILNPELAAMQVRAIATATARLIKEGLSPDPEIMIPLVSVTPELETLRRETEAVLAEVAAEFGVELNLPIGTMIELPRAVVTADDIARYADFFSFGTNDLTQTTFGFSRDDVESKFIPRYLERKLIPCNPFETIDSGVAKLVDMACKLGREGNAGITLGVCGEHGGDPDSVKIFHKIGLDYVSCSPHRVPLARLAAGQAALAEKHAVSDNR